MPFDEPQELDLTTCREVADFVEHQCAGGLLHQAATRAFGTGVGALAVAEQRVGEHGVVQPGEVDRHQLARPPAGPANRFGEQLLAGTGLAGDQDGLGRWSQRLDQHEQRLHAAVARDDATEAFDLAGAAYQPPL